MSVSVSAPDDEQSQNFIGLTIDGDDIIVRFSGIGGLNYDVQFKALITDPTWTSLDTVTATPNGQIAYRHVGAALNPTGFYRTVSQ